MNYEKGRQLKTWNEVLIADYGVTDDLPKEKDGWRSKSHKTDFRIQINGIGHQ